MKKVFKGKPREIGRDVEEWLTSFWIKEKGASEDFEILVEKF